MEWDRRLPLHRLLHQCKHRCLHWAYQPDQLEERKTAFGGGLRWIRDVGRATPSLLADPATLSHPDWPRPSHPDCRALRRIRPRPASPIML